MLLTKECARTLFLYCGDILHSIYDDLSVSRVVAGVKMATISGANFMLRSFARRALWCRLYSSKFILLSGGKFASI